MSHKIVVTALPNESRDDPEFTITGDCDHRCETWSSCDDHKHTFRSLDQRDEAEADGCWEWGRGKARIEHRHIDGEWMTRSGDCGVQISFEDGYYDDEIAALGLGAHDVTAEWDGEWWLLVFPDGVRADG